MTSVLDSGDGDPANVCVLRIWSIQPYQKPTVQWTDMKSRSVGPRYFKTNVPSFDHLSPTERV